MDKITVEQVAQLLHTDERFIRGCIESGLIVPDEDGLIAGQAIYEALRRLRQQESSVDELAALKQAHEDELQAEHDAKQARIQARFDAWQQRQARKKQLQIVHGGKVSA